MKPGDMLVFYTDGIGETQGSRRGRPPDRRVRHRSGLVEAAREHQGETAPPKWWRPSSRASRPSAATRPPDDDRTVDGGEPTR